MAMAKPNEFMATVEMAMVRSNDSWQDPIMHEQDNFLCAAYERGQNDHNNNNDEFTWSCAECVLTIGTMDCPIERAQSFQPKLVFAQAKQLPLNVRLTLA